MNGHLTITQRTNLKFGSIVGLFSFLLMLIDYFASRNSIRLAGYIEGYGALLILIVGIYYGIWHRKNKQLNSTLTFKQGLITGFIIALWTGLIYSLLSYSYVVFLNPRYVDEMLLIQTYNLPHDVTAAESVGARLIAEITYRPIFQLVGKFLESILVGLIISSFCAFFLSRRQKAEVL